MMVKNGETDPDAIAKIKEKYLGLNWIPPDDEFKYELTVNLTPKVRGVRPSNSLVITLSNLKDLHDTSLTMNMVASVVYSWYDPIGLICPLILKFKLLLSETIRAGIRWKEVLPEIFQEKWKSALEEAVRFGTILFPRTIKPSNVVGEPTLVGYADGSKVAFGAVLYIRWKLGGSSTSQSIVGNDNSSYPVTHTAGIIAAKAKVSKIENIPRNEMDGLILLARLVTAVLPGLTDKPISFLPILDSRCTIQSIEAESKTLKDFFNNRCEEYNEHFRHWSDEGLTIEPIHYTTSRDDVADLATRGNVVVQQLDSFSEWQNGPKYLCYTRDSSWPINREMISGQDSIPDVEKILRVYAIHDKSFNPGSDGILLSIRWVTERHSNLLKVLRIIARIITVSCTGYREDARIEPTADRISQARHLLEIVYGQDTALQVSSGKLVGLNPRLSKGRFVTRGRFGSGIAKVLGLIELPILLPESYLSYLIMLQAHLETHSAAKSSLARSRTQAWIVRGFQLAVKICNECIRCKIDKRIKVDQKMGFMPVERFEVGFPPFTNVSLDLAAPLIVLDMIKKRSHMKAWPLLICCLNTGAVHIELLHTYGADAFLVRWRVFTCIRGNPKLVISDKGSQLQAASRSIDWSRSEDPEGWQWQSIESATSNFGTKWRFVPPGCQWQNGLAESRIKIFKQTFRKCVVGTINGNKSYISYGEMQALLAEMMDRMNNRPIGLKALTDQDIVPLTPNCLLLGRTSTVVSSPSNVEFSEENYPKRLRYCQELLEFWGREFNCQVFYSLLPYQRYKDAKRHKNLEVGDVCLLAYSGKIGECVRYCRVDATHPDEDEVVRNVTVSLRSRDAREKLLVYRSRKPVKMTVGVQRLVLLCPVEEIAMSVGEVSENTIEDTVNLERRPGSGRKNGCDSLKSDCIRNEIDDGSCPLGTPGSRRENIGDLPLIRRPGSGREKVVVRVGKEEERIIDLC